MSLTQKLYGVYLADFVKEIRRDPGAGLTHNIQELAAKLEKRTKERELSVVDELFLTLYAQDPPSLKADLCMLMASEPAKKAALSAQQRLDLLQCLYEMLSSYIGENFRSIVEMCDQGVRTGPEPGEKLLSRFKEEVCRDPDADFAPHIQKLADEFTKRENECEKTVFDELFLKLYAQNTALLGRDLTKLHTLKVKKTAKPPERIVLLQGLCDALSLYIKEDLSGIIAMCERLDT